MPVQVGEKYGRLTVIEVGLVHVTRPGKRYSKARFRCDCGTEKVIFERSVHQGMTVSCGCHHAEAIGLRARTHGASRTRLYRIWEGMIGRCEYPKHRSYSRYGGAGIQVCAQWRNDFAFFAEWAKETGYEESLTIHRVDPAKDYCPENCAWLTRSENSRLTRRHRPLTAFGETKIIMDWVRDPRCSVTWQTIDYRLKQLGWDDERAIATPRLR